ncbi:MAG: vWA domain-containing protein [Paracoccaceae bacterium]|nr:vWA domain-containing protein [Paracoccaceae bacterium]
MKARSASTYIALAIAAFIAVAIFNEAPGRRETARAPVVPDWAAIASWPSFEASTVEATPDPGRTFTVIVLDDSGSMGSDIEPAKTAVVAALDAMEPADRVAVIGLNTGEILPFLDVREARGVLAGRLAPVVSDGGTPLTAAVRASRVALEAQASVAGGFGTYRILITTDGAADAEDALEAEIEDLARTTPIQVATIGVGIRGDHILRRPDLATFVEIDNVGELATALRDAIAEEQTFSAITTFEGG